MKIQNDLQPKKLLAESLQFITPGSKCGKTLTSVTSFTPNNLKEKHDFLKYFYRTGINSHIYIYIYIYIYRERERDS